MKRVITPVGISIFDNYLKKNKQGEDLLKNESLREARTNDLSHWEGSLEYIKGLICNWAKGNEDASAEIKSLTKIYNKYKEPLQVFLLATDTVLSIFAARIIKEQFKGNNTINVTFDYKRDVIAGLQVKDGKEFEEKGLINLFKRIEEIIGENREDVIFNINGGYKAVVPFLSLYAQLYKIPTYYIFELEDTLLTLPQLPISLDFEDIEENYFAFETINPGKHDKNLPAKDQFLRYLSPQEIYERLLENKLIYSFNYNGEEKVKLTVYGSLIFRLFQEKAGQISRWKGTFIELKLFEYFLDEHRNKKVEHSRWFGEYEADIFIKDNNDILVVEVRPGGDPKFNKIRENKINGLLPKIKEHYPNHQIKFHVYLYKKTEIPSFFAQEMEKCERANTVAKEIKWYWLKIDEGIYHSSYKIQNKHIKIFRGEYHV